MKLELHNVTKIFNQDEFNEVRAIHDIDLEFTAGENVLIIGHNGSGKSTLVFLIDGRLSPTNGEILLDGRSLNHIPVHSRAQNIYRLFQDSSLGVIPLATIRENMAIATRRHSPRHWLRPLLRGRDDKRFRQVMKEYRPELESKLDKKVFTLSPGERQAVVLALLKLQTNQDPQILIADEPTASLDPELACRCVSTITDYASEGWICLTITHDSGEIQRHEGRTIKLRNGEVLRDDRAGEGSSLKGGPKHDRQS